MTPILLIKTGDTFPELKARCGDFETMMANCLPAGSVDLTVYDARGEQPLPDLTAFSGIILTGSHSMVTDCEPWSERLLPYIQEMRERSKPVLAVCYGHQLMAKAFGGEVGFHPKGPEAGSVAVHLTEAGQQDALLGQLPPSFSANVGHSQTVTRLPADAVLLARNDFEPNEAYRIGETMWAVQFHPEFDQAITQYYIERIADEITHHNGDPVALSASCTETPHSRSLLVNFANKCKELSGSNAA